MPFVGCFVTAAARLVGFAEFCEKSIRFAQVDAPLERESDLVLEIFFGKRAKLVSVVSFRLEVSARSTNLFFVDQCLSFEAIGINPSAGPDVSAFRWHLNFAVSLISCASRCIAVVRGPRAGPE